MSALSLIRLVDTLNENRFILASKSPRRLELLKTVTADRLNIEVLGSTFPENLDKNTLKPAEYVLETATEKSKEVIGRLEPPISGHFTMVLSADTVVVANGKILEKPEDHAHAMEMLKALRGKTHEVITDSGDQNSFSSSPPPGTGTPGRPGFFAPGKDRFLPLEIEGLKVCALAADGPMVEEITAGSLPALKFHINNIKKVPLQISRNILSDEDLEAYVDTEEPMGKAGSYGIQGIGGLLACKVDGCYSNVVGLPVHDTAQAIAECNVVISVVFPPMGSRLKDA